MWFSHNGCHENNQKLFYTIITQGTRQKASSISMKHEADFFWNVTRRKAPQHHANLTVLEALICTRRIAELTASCYILLESILFGPELLSNRFFNSIPTINYKSPGNQTTRFELWTEVWRHILFLSIKLSNYLENVTKGGGESLFIKLQDVEFI
jgi:hypothetical protein